MSHAAHVNKSWRTNQRIIATGATSNRTVAMSHGAYIYMIHDTPWATVTSNLPAFHTYLCVYMSVRVSHIFLCVYMSLYPYPPSPSPSLSSWLIPEWLSNDKCRGGGGGRCGALHPATELTVHFFQMSALYLFEEVNLGKELTFEGFYEWRVVHEVHCFHHLPYDLYIWMYVWMESMCECMNE